MKAQQRSNFVKRRLLAGHRRANPFGAHRDCDVVALVHDDLACRFVLTPTTGRISMQSDCMRDVCHLGHFINGQRHVPLFLKRQQAAGRCWKAAAKRQVGGLVRLQLHGLRRQRPERVPGHHDAANLGFKGTHGLMNSKQDH